MKVHMWLGAAAIASVAAGSAYAGGCCRPVPHYKPHVYYAERSQTRFLGCFNRVYVPARLEINTRGALVRPGGKHWNVDTADENWTLLRDPPVFVQTAKVVDPDHYTLVPKNCNTGGPVYDPVTNPAEQAPFSPASLR